MSLSQIEQETIINFNEKEAQASIYTYNKTLIRKLQRLADQRSESVEFVSEISGGYTFIVPKKWARINPPRKAPPLSEEEKKRIGQRLKESRLKNKILRQE